MPPLNRYGSPLLDRSPSAPRRVWFRLCTRDVDRHGTLIEPSGVDLTSHKQNPVFLWMHDSGGGDKATPPPDVVIGRVVDYDQSFEALDIEVEFDDDGEFGLASTCYRKVRSGFLNMVSIGCSGAFDTVTLRDGVEVPTCQHSELLECSLVIIGSNRAALKLDRAAVAAMLRDGGGEVAAPPPPPLPPSPDRHVAVVACFDPSGAMLWGRRRDDGKWTTPGGHLDLGESPLAGALRELEEEAGVDAWACNGTVEYLGVVELRRDATATSSAHTTFVHCFRVDLPETVTPSSAGDPDREVAEWHWVALGEDGLLPDEVAANLHSPKNALRDLGVIRSVGGPAATQSLLSDFADVGDFDDALFSPGEDGLVVKAATTRAVVPHKHFPVSDGPWDADAAVGRWRRWASSDGTGSKGTIDWKKYAECFLWFDDADPEHFSSYKFPHHDVVRGVPVTVWRGVVAAAARLDQARGVSASDLAEMRQHLADHYREAGKTPPWQRRDVGGVASLLRRGLDPAHADVVAMLPPAIRAAFAGTDTASVPTPSVAVKDGPLHTPVGVGDAAAPLVCKLTPHALLFPSSRFTVADAVVWAKDHGYAPSPAREVGDGFSHKGLVVTENSVLVEQLPATVFQPSPFGPGLKWTTVLYGNGVWCVYGVLKTSRRSLEATAAAVLSGADTSASPSARAELALCDDAQSRAVVATSRWSPLHLKVPDSASRRSTAPTRDLARITKAISDLRAAANLRDACAGDFAAVAPVASSLSLYRNAEHYAVHDTAPRPLTTLPHTPDALRSIQPQAPHVPTETPMKRTLEARSAYRGMIQHAMEHADMHVRAMEDGLVADEMKPAHRAMAMRALDSADEMHECMRSAFLGDKAGQAVVVDAASGPTDGEIFNLPRTADAEMSARFAAVATKVGKLPRSLRGIVKAELGTTEGDLVEEKLMGLKGVQERFVSLQTEHARGLASVEKAATEKLIEDALDGQLITPAEAKRFRGIDPATGAATLQPFAKARVERFVEERRQLGPVADIKRPGAQRSVQQDETGHNVATPKKTSLIRAGFGVQRPATEQEQGALAADIAAQMAARYGASVNAADILSRTADAAELPNSEGAESIKRAASVK